MQETHTKNHSSRHHGHNILQAEKLELVNSGDDYFTRALAIIERSKKKIHFQTYIFIDDSTGHQVIDALARAVKRGVEVYLLVDAFGSFAMSREGLHTIEKSGIKFRKFSPLFVNHRIRFGRRLHHKILLSDESEALIGGINVEDKYHLTGNKTPWLDFAVYLTGPVCQYISYICEHTWQGKFYNARMRRRYKHHQVTNEKAGIAVRIRQNDWALRKEGVSRSYRNALSKANYNIIIVGAYFLPGRRIRNILKSGSERNVKIKLILQGASDVTLVKKAGTWLYAWMLRNNFEIYEWDKTILHGKLTYVDNDWVSVGSYNINHLSDYASIETNVDVHDAAFSTVVKAELDDIIKNSTPVTSSDYHQKMNTYQQFTCWLSFHIVRILFGLQFALLAKE